MSNFPAKKTTFDSTKTELSKLLDEIVEGKIQLPDFQRGWVWSDEHIRSLLVSLARSFPIGAVMLLETGGEAKFQARLVEGLEPTPGLLAAKPDKLILDGQQRLTSLTQVLKLKNAVATRDEKKRDLRVHYYFDIETALRGPTHLEDAIVVVDEKKTLRANFGRTVTLDLSDLPKEIAAFHFPCSSILDSRDWEYALRSHADKLLRFMEFREHVLDPIRGYLLPVIELKKHTSKEAVCLVFEKVNTGGVPLSVFELVTATWAAEGTNLREDWYGVPAKPGVPAVVGRHARVSEKRPLLRDLQPTDFLQAVCLLHSFERREADRALGKAGKELAAVTAKREHILELPLGAYQKWAGPLTQGFAEVDRFLRSEGFHSPRFLPYRSQIVPLAAVMARIGNRWLEPKIKDKLARWFWCGVLGELYGGAIETRIALDLQDLVAWVDNPAAPPPTTVQAAGFQPNRLDTLRSRTSAAYRGIYVLLQREGARDFFWKARMVELDRDDVKIDIHHVFPRKWCNDRKISPRTYDAIVNKTAISYKANRMIGGKAPSEYLAQIQDHEQVQLEDPAMDDILRSHMIDPTLLRADKFEAFYAARKAALLGVIARVMGKPLPEAAESVPDDDADEDEEDDAAA